MDKKRWISLILLLAVTAAFGCSMVFLKVFQKPVEPDTDAPQATETATDAPRATETATDAPAPQSPLDGAALLQATAAALGTGHALRVDLEAQITANQGAITQNSSIAGSIELGENNLGTLHLKDEHLSFSIHNDAQNCVTFLSEKNQYIKTPAMKTRSELLSRGFPGIMEVPLHWLTSLLAGAVPDHDALTVSEASCDGVPCRALQADSPEYELTLSLSQATPPTPLSMEVVLKPEAMKKHRAPANLSVKMTLTFHDWQLAFEPPQDYFTFVPPAGAVEATQDTAAAGNAPREGDTAPLFTLPSLNGESVDLQNYVGGHVLILDFWATWCGPCRRVLPVLAKLSQEFAERNVLLFTINQRETPEKIQGFLEQQGLDVKVLLDSAGVASRLYHVTGIPRIVIIGKDGTIKKIYAGFSETLEASIAAVLEEMTAS
ncbi:MAG: redoxin domain-containing protein [Candidatus Hydrogenedentes bacterium]|nr:redoxin domain-containing protein [Candidatus Hydrogenedentota bacterium]